MTVKPPDKKHPENELVFAYGSNMDMLQMKKRCRSSKLEPFVARLEGWKLCFPRRSEKRNGGVGSIVRDRKEVVWGLVFRITPKDLESLDGYEGVSAGAYRRERLGVTARNGKKCAAWTYLAVPQETPPNNYAPSKEYLALFIRGARYFKLPSAYIQELKRIETARRNR